jgi:hypothetical protein
MKLDIITGTSFFTDGLVVVGVALPGCNDSVDATKWADKVGKGGRPCTVENVQGKLNEQQTIEYLKKRWLDWASQNEIEIKFGKVRRNVGLF